MGLDMYLFKAKRSMDLADRVMLKLIWSIDEPNQVRDSNLQAFLLKHTVPGEDNGQPTSKMTREIGYWRKANSIHWWLYQNCCPDGDPDYRPFVVTAEKLNCLKEVCKKLLVINQTDKAKAVAVAKEDLPTRSGFFFGSTDYGDSYWEDLENTVKIITSIQEKLDDSYYMFYWANY
jgi:hypothetical protein